MFMLVCALAWCSALNAFEVSGKPAWGFSGYVKNVSFWDSRQVDGARENDYSLFPKNRVPDVLGNDINAAGQFGIMAIDSNLSLTVGNVFIGKHKKVELTGEVEVNFLGIREGVINQPQLTFGYLALNTENSQLLCGQYEIPLFIVDAAPNTVSYGWGSPVEPFSYLPDVRFTYKWKSGWQIMVGAHSEIAEAASVGFVEEPPEPFVLPQTEVSSRFFRDSKVPILSLRVRKNFGESAIIAGAQYHRIKPRLYTSADFIAHEHVDAWSAYGAIKIVCDPVKAVFKALYAENGWADGLLGTYGIRSIEMPTQRFTYTPLRAANVWLDCQASDPGRFNPGIFIGFSKNLGTTKPLMNLADDPGYGFTSYKQLLLGSTFFENDEDLDINWLLKVMPRLYVLWKSFQIGTEFEYNCVSYGNSINQFGRPVDTHNVNHFRLMVAAYYFF
jgi:hypothetical protein